MTEFRQFKDPLAEIRANQAVLAGRIAALEARRPHHPTPHPDPRCEAISPDEAEARCYLWEGHDGGHVFWRVAIKWGPYCGAESGTSAHMHRCLLAPGKHIHVCDDCGYKWADPEHTLDDQCPVCFGCCGGEDVTDDDECCGRGPACGACDDPEPLGCPACDGVAGTARHCPEPVPQWRELVDTGESAIWADAGPEIGLSRVLQDLVALWLVGDHEPGGAA